MSLFKYSARQRFSCIAKIEVQEIKPLKVIISAY